MTMLNHPFRSGSADARSLINTAIVLCSAALITLTAFALGARWLAAPLLGLPIGLWLIAATYVLWKRGWLSHLDRTLPYLSSINLRFWQPSDPTGRAHTLRRHLAIARAATLEASSCLWNLEFPTAEHFAARIARRLDQQPELARPLTVGIIAPAPRAAALRDPDSPLPVEWLSLEADDHEPATRCDILLHTDPLQGGRATIPASPHASATWHDWSRPRPLAFPSVFPHQIDPAQLTFATLPDFDQHDPLVGALLVAAATHARMPSRLSLNDRRLGRAPLDGLDTPGLIDPGAFSVRAMTRIADLLASRDPSHAHPTERFAAAALGAYLVTPAARLSIGARRAIIERIHPFAAHRPESWLRLAALRFADIDDRSAIDAMLAADPLVRAHAEELVLDQTAFVQSELDHGIYDPLALGRVAAGLCLIAAQHEYERLAFLKDDLIEDLSYAGWLVGRDQDTALLHRVLEELLRVRRAESRGLPNALAA